MRDIAQAVGLSQTAVSLALRNSPQIPEARRLEIKAAARKLGYTPNAAAISLTHFKRRSRSMPIQAALAWLNFWPDPKRLRSIPLFDANWRGALEAAHSLGYHLQEFICDKSLPPDRLKRILTARGVQGILLPPQRPPIPREKFDFDWSRFAVVRFGHTVIYPQVHLVSHSQARDSMLAFRKILDKGYRRIGHITTATIRTFGLFDGGFLKSQALVKEQDRVPILVLDDWPQPTRDVLEKINTWVKKYRPDAIISTEGNIKALLTAAGFQVPRDFGLAATSISNCDVDAGMFENPEEVGRTAVKNLVGLIQRNEMGIPEYPHEILVRGKWTDGACLPPRAPG
jgi:DNA-binding LacI/PurR family transcriptional regulator